MAWHPEKPYNALPLLPPKAELETRPVLKQCINARAALAELKQSALRIPNQAVLMNNLPLLEARDSSEIENIVTTTDRLFQFAHSDAGADPATREVLRYRSALYKGWEQTKKRPLNTNLAESLCSVIKDLPMRVRKVPGTKLGNQKTGKTICTPPDGEKRLRDLLTNRERMQHEQEELDPLVRMAVAHYQFGAIHPFTDGNGRTGRLLNILYLVQQGLIDLPILYLSRYINAHRNAYYDGLIAVTRDEAWESWLLFMLNAVTDTATWTNGKIAAIHQLAEHTAQHVRTTLPKIYTRELVDMIFEQPYCRIDNLVSAGIAKRQTASEYLKRLTEIGVLKEQKASRELLFIHPKLITLLTRDNNKFSPYR
ncbi:MAG: Fic family protein [Proteobacteria bacterium]|nr:Fic family protein [Pseudomonadota bacterium]